MSDNTEMNNAPYIAETIADLHRLFLLSRPVHPLITVFKLGGKQCLPHDCSNSLVFEFYSVWYKKDAYGFLGYGQRQFDFSTGTFTFQAPGQVITVNGHGFSDGWVLAFHPNLIRQHPLIHSIRDFAFFSYDVFQGLNLLPEQEAMVGDMVGEVDKEIQLKDRQFGQAIMVAQLELLLNQLNRFFRRQNGVRTKERSDFLSKVENELQNYFGPRQGGIRPLLTVGYLAGRLNLTPHHLSQKIKSMTGTSALQHIHEVLVGKAKDILSSTNLSISEVAYQIGFEHPQSFSKFFKNKTGSTPFAFRQSFQGENRSL